VNARENQHESNMAGESLGFIFLADSMGLASASMSSLAFSKKTPQNGHNAVQGHSKSPILVQIESLYATSY